MHVTTICDQNGANCKTISGGWGAGGSVTEVGTGVVLWLDHSQPTAPNVDVGTTANKIMQLTAGAQIPNVDGYLVTNVNAANIAGKQVSAAAPTAGQVLTYNNSTSKWDSEATQAVLPALATADIWVGNGGSAATAVAPSGDVTMSSTALFTVAGIQGKAVSNIAPTDAQVLFYNATTSKWVAASLSGDAAVTNNGVVTVGALQGRSVSAAAPGAGQVLTWNNATTKWDAEASQAALPTLSSADIWIGSAGNAATPIAPSGDVTMTNTGLFTVAGSRARRFQTSRPPTPKCSIMLRLVSGPRPR